MVAIAKRLASAHKMSLLQRDHFKATHDPLTGLLNQVALDERIDHEISIGARYHKKFAVIILEVDRFLESGSVLGRSSTDKLVIDFATRLKSCIRSTDMVARYEDNVFAIMLPDIPSYRSVVKVIQSINIELISPFTVSDNNVFITPKIGISLYPNDAENRQQLIEQAHIAMCQARSDENRNYRYYSTDIDIEVEHKIGIEDKIRKAIDTHNYDIQYQPVHSLKDNVTYFVDSVIHWADTELDSENSRSVSKAIESMGLGKLFTDIKLNDICRQILIWEAGRAHTKIPVLHYVPNEQFKYVDLADRFKSIVKNQNVSSGSIALVIDEQSVLDDVIFAMQQLRALKQCGFKIVIDNFSSGLSYIGKLSNELVDLIRIDSQMVDELDNCMDWLCVVEGILKIAQSLKFETIIGGINNRYQYKTLQNLGSAFWQGDYSYLMGNSEERNSG